MTATLLALPVYSRDAVMFLSRQANLSKFTDRLTSTRYGCVIRLTLQRVMLCYNAMFQAKKETLDFISRR
jgi:hypothetical protein